LKVLQRKQGKCREREEERAERGKEKKEWGGMRNIREENVRKGKI